MVLTALSHFDGSITGSGKSYTMMGTVEEKGIIPRLCDSLFDRIAKLETETTGFKVEVSYMEIYNEKVHDLLDLKGYGILILKYLFVFGVHAFPFVIAEMPKDCQLLLVRKNILFFTLL